MQAGCCDWHWQTVVGMGGVDGGMEGQSVDIPRVWIEAEATGKMGG